MAIAKGFGGLRRIGLYEDRIRIRQRHCEVVQLAFDPTDHAQSLAKIHLCMTRGGFCRKILTFAYLPINALPAKKQIMGGID